MKPTPKNKRPLTAKILAVVAIVATLASVLVITASADWIGGETAVRYTATPMYPYTILQSGKEGDEHFHITTSPDVIPVSNDIGINELDGYSVENADGIVVVFRSNPDYTNVSGYTTPNGISPRGYLLRIPTYRISIPITDGDATMSYITSTLTIGPTTIYRGGDTPTFSMGSIGNVSSPTASYRCEATFVNTEGTPVTISRTGTANHVLVEDGLYTYDIGSILTFALEADHDVNWDYPVSLDNLTITTTAVGTDEYDVPQQIYYVPYLYAASANPIYPSVNAYDLIPRITERLDVETLGERIYTAVDNVLSVQIYPDITIGMLFSVVMGIVLLVVFVKLFAGG